MNPEGKVALVTGGASGIGLACVKELLKNGASVAMCDIDANAADSAMKEITNTFHTDRLIFIKLDITKDGEFEEAFKTTLNHFRRLDIVFNNAGILEDNRWEHEIDVNVKGTIRGTLLALKYMGKDNGGNGGVIVNTSSIAGLIGLASFPMYSATKHAVVGLVKSLGAPFHFNRTGVRIVSLCPSATDTPILHSVQFSLFSDDWISELSNICDTSSLVKPDVVAQSFLHLVRIAESGSVWVSEGSETYPLLIPHYKDMRMQNRIYCKF